MNTEPWVSAEQVAQHLGVAKDTVYRWRERRGVPAHRIGRLWKFKLSEVDEWVRAGGADRVVIDNYRRVLQHGCTHMAEQRQQKMACHDIVRTTTMTASKVQRGKS